MCFPTSKKKVPPLIPHFPPPPPQRTMGKKRRSTTKKNSTPTEQKFDPADAKIAPINSWEDIADEEDLFHLQRDKISLSRFDEGGHRGRGEYDEDEGEGEEVVMGLEEFGYPQSDSDDGVEKEDDGVKQSKGRGRKKTG
jgi:U3 small nucleolar RNA-associated protein 3